MSAENHDENRAEELTERSNTNGPPRADLQYTPCSLGVKFLWCTYFISIHVISAGRYRSSYVAHLSRRKRRANADGLDYKLLPIRLESRSFLILPVMSLLVYHIYSAPSTVSGFVAYMSCFTERGSIKHRGNSECSYDLRSAQGIENKN